MSNSKNNEKLYLYGGLLLKSALSSAITALGVINAKGKIKDTLFLPLSISLGIGLELFIYFWLNSGRGSIENNNKNALENLRAIVDTGRASVKTNFSRQNNLKETQGKESKNYAIVISVKIVAAVGASLFPYFYKNDFISKTQYYFLLSTLLIFGIIGSWDITYDRLKNTKDSKEILRLSEKILKKDRSAFVSKKGEKNIIFWTVINLTVISFLIATNRMIGVQYAQGFIKDITFILFSLACSITLNCMFLWGNSRRREATTTIRSACENLKKAARKSEQINDEYQKTDFFPIFEGFSQISAVLLSIFAPYLYKKDQIGEISYYFLLLISVLLGSVTYFGGKRNRLDNKEASKELFSISAECIEKKDEVYQCFACTV